MPSTSTYIYFNKENNKKDPKFKVGDPVKYQEKIFFQKLHCKMG